MRVTQMADKFMVIGASIVMLAAGGAVIEGLHWAFFEPKPIGAWIAVLAAAAGLVKWLHWELYGRPEEPSEGEKKYAAWFDA
jgi:hypothetical protein